MSDEVVAAYLRDLVERLACLDGGIPEIWLPIGPSGGAVARAAMAVAGDRLEKISHIPVTYERSTNTIHFPKEADPSSFVRGKKILLIDGSIHSGTTLRAAYRAVEELQPKDISSYSLVVRAGASILPCFWGLMIGDHDRAFFLRRLFPNHRLPTFGCVRKLEGDDLQRPMIVSGEDFIDKFSWSDYTYELNVDPNRRTYVYEQCGTIRGFVSFRFGPGRATVLIDSLAVAQGCQGQGLGGHLLRWAETCARNAHCAVMELWAVAQRREFYERQFYKALGKTMDLDDASFVLMGKKLLYNLPDDEVLTMGS
jgi:GNAT superfamily N-acetyltransferase